MRDSKTGPYRTEIENIEIDAGETGGAVFRGAASFASFAALFVAARLWRLTASCLWFDEIFSVHAARHDWAGMLRFVAADLIHPPLFYALLKVWINLGGESLLWLRLFPALTAAACLIPFSMLCRTLRLSAPQTNLALLLIAANGYLIKYAQEVRMYSLLLFLTLSSLWLFVRFFNTDGAAGAPIRRQLFALAGVNLLLVYTHYYGWLVVATEFAFLLLHRRGRAHTALFSISVMAIAFCFAPWVYVLARAAGRGQGLQQNLGWMARPGLSDVAQLIMLLTEPFYFRQSSGESPYTLWSAPLGLLLFVLPVIALLWRALWRPSARCRADALRESAGEPADGEKLKESPLCVRDGRQTVGLVWLSFFAFLPVGLAFILSFVLPQSVWGTRHLIIVAAPYAILAAVAVRRLHPLWLGKIIPVVFGCWLCVAALVLAFRRQSPYIWCAWEELAAHLKRDETTLNEAATTGAFVKLYAFEDLVAYHLWFALDVAGEKNFKVAVVRNVPGLAGDPAYFLPRDFDRIAVADLSTAFHEERFWVAFSAPLWDESRPPLKLLKERGYEVTKASETGAPTAGLHAFLALAARPEVTRSTPGRADDNSPPAIRSIN